MPWNSMHESYLALNREWAQTSMKEMLVFQPLVLIQLTLLIGNGWCALTAEIAMPAEPGRPCLALTA